MQVYGKRIWKNSRGWEMLGKGNAEARRWVEWERKLEVFSYCSTRKTPTLWAVSARPRCRGVRFSGTR